MQSARPNILQCEVTLSCTRCAPAKANQLTSSLCAPEASNCTVQLPTPPLTLMQFASISMHVAVDVHLRQLAVWVALSCTCSALMSCTHPLAAGSPRAAGAAARPDADPIGIGGALCIQLVQARPSVLQCEEPANQRSLCPQDGFLQRLHRQLHLHSCSS